MAGSRWKSVERETAYLITSLVSDIGMSAVSRIPILGREGPDITINELELVVNVKSRLKIPKWIYAPDDKFFHYGDLVGFRLKHLMKLTTLSASEDCRCWKQLTDWYDHMEQWTKDEHPTGITAIFLHRPRMPIGNMTVVIHQKHLRRLYHE